jgi:hypothetical protein
MTPGILQITLIGNYGTRSLTGPNIHEGIRMLLVCSLQIKLKPPQRRKLGIMGPD